MNKLIKELKKNKNQKATYSFSIDKNLMIAFTAMCDVENIAKSQVVERLIMDIVRAGCR